MKPWPRRIGGHGGGEAVDAGVAVVYLRLSGRSTTPTGTVHSSQSASTDWCVWARPPSNRKSKRSVGGLWGAAHYRPPEVRFRRLASLSHGLRRGKMFVQLAPERGDDRFGIAIRPEGEGMGHHVGERSPSRNSTQYSPTMCIGVYRITEL